MEVIWKNNVQENSPILFKREATWNELRVRHLRVLAGELPNHITKFNEVNLSLDGSLFTQRHTSSGKTRCDMADSDSMCMLPVGQTLTANWNHEYEYVAIDFSQNHLSQMALEMNLSAQIELKETISKKDILLQHLGLALLDEADKKEASSRLYSESMAHTLMFHLLKNYSTANFQNKSVSGGLSGNKLRRVTDFINDNLEQDLTLAEIATIAGLSHFHFARMFRKTMGVTPQQYITNRRIEKAKELLAKSNLPIVEVGFQIGFKNQSHFTTLFRKFTSLTPKIWREVKQN